MGNREVVLQSALLQYKISHAYTAWAQQVLTQWMDQVNKITVPTNTSGFHSIDYLADDHSKSRSLEGLPTGLPLKWQTRISGLLQDLSALEIPKNQDPL